MPNSKELQRPQNAKVYKIDPSFPLRNFNLAAWMVGLFFIGNILWFGPHEFYTFSLQPPVLVSILIGFGGCLVGLYYDGKRGYKNCDIEIWDNKTLKYCNTRKGVFKGKVVTLPISSITEMCLLQGRGGRMIEMGIGIDSNGKSYEIPAVNWMFEPENIKQFLQDITKIKPNIKLDKPLSELRDKAGANFKSILA